MNVLPDNDNIDTTYRNW